MRERAVREAEMGLWKEGRREGDGRRVEKQDEGVADG